MLENYEINYDTLAIIPINKNTSKVIEKEQTYLVNKNSVEIIDDSCKYFGSNFKGRQEGTKYMLGIIYKRPIIIEESRNIIFFPTSSPRYNNCYWVSFNNIKSCEKYNKYSKIKFTNNYLLELKISYESLQNQILRATLLDAELRKRIK